MGAKAGSKRAKQARGEGSETKTQPKRSDSNGNGASELHVRVLWDGERLANRFAQIATRTIYAAAAGDKAFIAKVKDCHKWTDELDELHQMAAPEEVQEWVRKLFGMTGPVQRAIESQLRIALVEWSLAPAAAGATTSTDARLMLVMTSENTVEVDARGGPDTKHCQPFCSGP